MRLTRQGGRHRMRTFETATQHDTIPCLRVLTVGFSSSDPNMQMPRHQFPNAQFKLSTVQRKKPSPCLPSGEGFFDP
jgi:hypothetical protein